MADPAGRNRSLVDLLVRVAPVSRGEDAAPMLRWIERQTQEWVDEDEGLIRLEHRAERTVV